MQKTTGRPNFSCSSWLPVCSFGAVFLAYEVRAISSGILTRLTYDRLCVNDKISWCTKCKTCYALDLPESWSRFERNCWHILAQNSFGYGLNQLTIFWPMLMLANYKPIFLRFVKLKSSPADRYLWASVKAEWFKGEVVDKADGFA